MKAKPSTRQRWLCATAFVAVTLSTLPMPAATPTAAPDGNESGRTIPWSEVGAAVEARYSGDGLMVTPTRDGARLRCVFQRMEGEATPEGLWLSSTATKHARDRFRVTAAKVGRGEEFGVRRQSAAATPLWKGSLDPIGESESGVALPFPPQSKMLPATGNVTVDGQTVRFTRPGLVEEYSVSMDGVRQDFVVLERPGRASVPASRLVSSLAPPVDGELRVELAVTGARVEPTALGAQLILEHSGRKIAYSRLKVTDATGRELPARMEAIGKSEIRELKSEVSLAILVDDADAVYPVRIDPTFSDANWISMGGFPGTDGWVNAAVADASGNLYIGGWFTAVGCVAANSIAKWNGSSWAPLGSGVNGDQNLSVSAMAVSGSDVYAAGWFTTAGGVAATNIAKWDGSSWSALGSGIGGNPQGMAVGVFALAIEGGNLYAGGHFTMAGGAAVTNIAKWDGTGWNSLGDGIGGGSLSAVYALMLSGIDLYAGGEFTTAGNSPAYCIAKWNGNNWSALGSGVNSSGVRALAVLGDDLYAGGSFTTAGGIAATNIAKWNGSNWSALGSGLSHSVKALAVSGSDLFAGGWFTAAGGIAANRIARWDGSSWSALGSGMDDYFVSALTVSGSELYAGGQFTTAGARGIAKWNGSTWSALASGMRSHSFYYSPVSALAVSGSGVYAGGAFTAAGDGLATNIAKWNGSSWSPLDSGVSGPPSSLHNPGGAVYALAPSGNDMYAGGAFTNAGGVAANYIAKWDGSRWSALGSGMNGAVYALVVSSGGLYAGGGFTMAGGVAATNIAKWDGTNWSPLGSGIVGGVLALAVSGTDLYAGGQFTNAGGVSATSIAKWDGTNWSALGSGSMDGSGLVYALAVSGSKLYAGGSFTSVGGVPANCIVKWNGSTWSPLGSGLLGAGHPDGGAPFYVTALAVSGTNLYVGGLFDTMAEIPASHIARWDGNTWSALGSGVFAGWLNAAVSALAVSGSELYVGGSFRTAGGKVSPYVAKAIINPPVLTLERSNSGTNFIRFSAVPGTAYHLQRAPNLAGPWPNIATNIAPATGRVEVCDGSPPSGRAFYRVVEP